MSGTRVGVQLFFSLAPGKEGVDGDQRMNELRFRANANT